MSFNTGNELGSLDERDLYDNAINLDKAMNSADPTWRDRFNVEKPTIDAALKSAGFMPAGFDFVTGGTLQPGDRNKAVYNPAPNGDNNWYRWNGVFPKEIAANSQPNPKDKNNWVPVIIKTGVVEREALRRTYQEVGLNLVEGSFEQGGVLTSANDVLLQESTGNGYRWDGGFSNGGKIVPPNSTPASQGGVGPDLWLDQAQTVLRTILESINGPGIIGFNSSIAYTPASVGYRLANSIDITDAPYNARPNQTDISVPLAAALATGRPIYFPEPKNPANYYLVVGTVRNDANTIIHGPKQSRIVFSEPGPDGGYHLHACGKLTHVYGLTLESLTRDSIIRAMPLNAGGIDEVKCIGTSFKGGFYAVRAGDSPGTESGNPVRKVTIIDCESEAPQGLSAGHFLCYGVDRVRYLTSSVKYGKNTSAFGAAACKDVLIDGCTERGVAQTLTGVEAAAQIEDCVNCHGRVVNCDFEHDIWFSSSSGVKAIGNYCRELRISTGSNYTFVDVDDILFAHNTAARISIQKYGSVVNDQRCSADFFDNLLDPASHSNLGSPYSTSHNIQGSVCNLIRMKGTKTISDATTYAVSLSRDAGMRLEIDDQCRFGTKPHNISGTTGRILSDISLEDALPGQGNTQNADILLGFSPAYTPTATGNFATIPFTNVAKNMNAEYAAGNISPLEDCVYHMYGAFSVSSPADNVRFAVQLYNATDDFVLVTLLDGRVWTGSNNTLPISAINIELLAGKVYRLRYVTGDAGCSILSGLANTYMAIKALV